MCLVRMQLFNMGHLTAVTMQHPFQAPGGHLDLVFWYKRNGSSNHVVTGPYVKLSWGLCVCQLPSDHYSL